MNFTEAQLLTYTSQNNFLLNGEFRYGSTKMLTIESYIDTRISNEDASGVMESQKKIMEPINFLILMGLFCVIVIGYYIMKGK